MNVTVIDTLVEAFGLTQQWLFETLVQPVVFGLGGASILVDADFQLARPAVLAARAADGVGSPHVLAVNGGAQREELPRLELECVAQRSGHIESDRNRLGRLWRNAFDGKGMKMGH